MERKFILDTDWYTDCDDCAALRYLVRKLDGGHKLLGVNVNADNFARWFFLDSRWA